MPDETVSTFDVLVVGGGVAGLAAAATAASFGLRTLLAEHLAAGGQVATVDHVDNYPGFPRGIAGYDLGALLQQQAEESGSAFLTDTVESIIAGDGLFTVACAGGSVRARAIIVAAGSRRRALNVPGEAELQGRGVSNCASCDGPIFRGQDVVVVGGGDSAYDEARLLAKHAATVTIIHRRSAPVARKALVERTETLANVRTVRDREVRAIRGDTAVQSVELDGGETLPTAAVFPYVGLAPNSAFVADLVELDPQARIMTDPFMRTSLPGMFAAGDIRAGSAGLLASAAGDGAMAAISAARYLGGRSGQAESG